MGSEMCIRDSPYFGSPGDRPYLGGFDLSAIDDALRESMPTVQDMSTLVLDNAQFRGEVADEQDRQWYFQLPDQDIDHPIEDEDSHAISDSAIADFAAYTEHNRSLSREQVAPVVSSSAASSSSVLVPGSGVSANAVADFTVFSARSRNLGRMNSEQALDFFLQHHS